MRYLILFSALKLKFRYFFAHENITATASRRKYEYIYKRTFTYIIKYIFNQSLNIR